jgi:hypothetical protein
MKMLSLEPDEHMRWIYDQTHPDYHTDYARDLRKRRDRALAACPRWMIEEARMNDILRQTPNVELTGLRRAGER